MPTFSDYLNSPTGVLGSLRPIQNVYVQHTNNITTTAYVTAAPTDVNGKYTQTCPIGIYTVAYATSATPPAWTSTGDTAYLVNDSLNIPTANVTGLDTALAEIEADIAGLEGSNVTSVAGRTGAVVLGEGDIAGLTTDLQNRPLVYSAKAYGAVESRYGINVQITTGTAAVTSTDAVFTQADVGRNIAIMGAGVAAAALRTTILSVQSATAATLAANAGTTVNWTTQAATLVAGRWMIWTDASTQIQAAIDAAYAAKGGTVLIDGIYACAVKIKPTVNVMGLNQRMSRMVGIPGSALAVLGSVQDNATFATDPHMCQVHDLVIDGAYQYGCTGRGIEFLSGNADAFFAGNFRSNFPFDENLEVGNKLFNLVVTSCGNDGIVLGTNNGESHVSSIDVLSCTGRAIWMKANDCTFVDVVAGVCSDGIEESANAFGNKYIGCKSWYMGRGGAPFAGLNGDGFRIEGAITTQLIGCESQDNVRYGIHCNNASALKVISHQATGDTVGAIYLGGNTVNGTFEIHPEMGSVTNTGIAVTVDGTGATGNEIKVTSPVGYTTLLTLLNSAKASQNRGPYPTGVLVPAAESAATPQTNNNNASDHFTASALEARWVQEATAPATAAIKNSCLSILAGATAGHYLQAFAPAGAFRVEARVACRPVAGGNGIGIFIRDSATGDTTGEGMYVTWQNNGASLFSLDAGVQTVRGATLTAAFTGWIYLAITRDGANQWNAYFSIDRVTWEQVGTGNYAKTMTVAKGGLRFGSNGTPVPCSVDFWDRVS